MVVFQLYANSVWKSSTWVMYHGRRLIKFLLQGNKACIYTMAPNVGCPIMVMCFL